MVSGHTGYWRVVGLSQRVVGGTTWYDLTLSGDALTAGTVTVTVPGPHGGLTVVHGGGNRPLQFTGTVTAGSGTLTRADGLSWSKDGFKAGQVVQLSGETETRTITGFGDATCTFAGETGFATCGKGAIMQLSGGAVTGGLLSVHVVDSLAVDGVRDRRRHDHGVQRHGVGQRRRVRPVRLGAGRTRLAAGDLR